MSSENSTLTLNDSYIQPSQPESTVIFTTRPYINITSPICLHKLVTRMAGLLRIALVLVAAAAAAVLGDLAKDTEECGEKLVGLAPCLTYAQGAAAAPTPGCCSGLRSALGSSPKCLCVLVKDRDDPNIGIHINLTRTLLLPSFCSVSVNISRCPELLNLAPNSPEAQAFKNLTVAGAAKGSSASANDQGKGGSTSVHPSSTARLRPWNHCSHLVVGGRWWTEVEHSLVNGLLLFLVAFVAA